MEAGMLQTKEKYLENKFTEFKDKFLPHYLH